MPVPGARPNLALPTRRPPRAWGRFRMNLKAQHPPGVAGAADEILLGGKNTLSSSGPAPKTQARHLRLVWAAPPPPERRIEVRIGATAGGQSLLSQSDLFAD